MLRFLVCWIISSLLFGTIGYVVERFQEGWKNHPNHPWLELFMICSILFFISVFIYLFIYWFLSSQLLIPIFENKKLFLIIWSVLFGIGMTLFVSFNSWGFTTSFYFLKMIIIFSIVGATIPFLDFELQKRIKKL